MRIHIEHNNTVVEYERRPMPERRFRALCSLALVVIAGGVFLGAISLVGVWAIVWAIGAFTLYGLYQVFKELCR